MVGDQDELPGSEPLRDPTRGVRDHERVHAEASEDADTEGGALGADPLVQVRATAEDRDRNPLDEPEDEDSFVSDGSRRRPARDLRVGDLDGVRELVR